MKKKDDGENGLQAGRRLASAAGAGLSMLMTIAIGMYLGLKADGYWGTYPLCFAGFSLLGAAGGLWSVIKKMTGK